MTSMADTMREIQTQVGERVRYRLAHFIDPMNIRSRDVGPLADSIAQRVAAELEVMFFRFEDPSRVREERIVECSEPVTFYPTWHDAFKARWVPYKLRRWLSGKPRLRRLKEQLEFRTRTVTPQAIISIRREGTFYTIDTGPAKPHEDRRTRFIMPPDRYSFSPFSESRKPHQPSSPHR
jgi:hypothetical protein